MKRRHTPMSHSTTSVTSGLAGSSMSIDTAGTADGSISGVTRRRRMTKRTRSGRPLTFRQRAQVNQIIRRNSELKFVILTAALTPVSSTAAMTSGCSTVAQGVADTQRVGDRLEWCGTMEVKIQVVNGEGATGDIYNNVRQVILQWHPNSIPAINQIFLPGPSSGTDVYSFYNHDNRQQYTILFDKVFTTVGNNSNATAAYADNLTTGIQSFLIPLNQVKGFQRQVQYSGGGAVGTNLIYQMSVSDSSLATHPSLALSTKLFYRDS